MTEPTAQTRFANLKIDAFAIAKMFQEHETRIRFLIETDSLVSSTLHKMIGDLYNFLDEEINSEEK